MTTGEKKDSRKRKQKYYKPEPLVGWRHPMRKTLQALVLLAAAVVGAHIGKFVVVALYYLFVEGAGHPWWATHEWHRLIGANGVIIGHHGILPGGDADRHMVRDVLEGLYGGLLGFCLAWNAYRKKIEKTMQAPPTALDRLEIKLRVPNLKDPKRLTIGQLVVSPFWVFVYSLPGLAVAYGLQKAIDALWHTTTFISFGSGHSWVTQLYTSNWYPILAGLFASYFMGKRPAFKVANDLQLWFAERRAYKGQGWRFYDTPAFKARVTDVKQRGERGETVRSSIGQGGWVGGVMVLLITAILAFAGYGAYVLTQIATHAK